MAEPADQEFLRSIFLMEAWDTVAALEGAAATLARPGGQDALFVVTHRLKGAASLHGFPKIAERAAELEEELAGQPLDTRALTTLVGHLKRALDAAAGAPAGRGVAVAAGLRRHARRRGADGLGSDQGGARGIFCGESGCGFV